jgi:hypothetical protein
MPQIGKHWIFDCFNWKKRMSVFGDCGAGIDGVIGD